MAANVDDYAASVSGCFPDEFDHSELATTVYGIYYGYPLTM